MPDFIIRFDDDCAGEIITKQLQHQVFTFRFYTSALGQIGPQMAFGQQIREKGMQFHPGRAELSHQFACLIDKGLAEYRPSVFVDVIFTKGEYCSITLKQ